MKTPSIEKENKMTQKEIETIFKEIRPAEKVFTPLPVPESENNPADRWVIIGGSSKPNNKFVEVSAWQTGQAF